ncbi:hypothetical protein BXT86_04355 [candidate division WOR-3 bacterium 4484_100]|uniref:DUF86 domain-containing protein n=1 Tax=candidate division WOR-3 bacterium 4484_100 TaxID=1936077 RepID=A0A1V4QEQ3_UNCW3|nr:MAG: hypothetical protein BXT86_04355 [candidate division WOR-3 bacterium 4484_100]
MNADDFSNLHKSLTKNIEEIKSMVKNKTFLKEPENVKSLERLKYLFYSLIKSLIDIGHSIVLENDFRDPLNRADIFISLAENKIILPSVVPGVKKAVIALPRINSTGPEEITELIGASINDLHKCLDSFVVYFKLKDKT